MKYEIQLPADVESSLHARAHATGKDVVHLIQMAVTRFVCSEPTVDYDTQGWTVAKDDRRCELIDREIAGTISVTERAELAMLQEVAERYFDEIAAPPVDYARDLHQRLLSQVDG